MPKRPMYHIHHSFVHSFSTIQFIWNWNIKKWIGYIHSFAPSNGWNWCSFIAKLKSISHNIISEGWGGILLWILVCTSTHKRWIRFRIRININGIKFILIFHPEMMTTTTTATTADDDKQRDNTMIKLILFTVSGFRIYWYVCTMCNTILIVVN